MVKFNRGLSGREDKSAHPDWLAKFLKVLGTEIKL
jgi:hypothetical protein